MLCLSVNSPSFFEQHPHKWHLRTRANPFLSTACTHLFFTPPQPVDSKQLPHSSKNIGGIPLFVPFRNSSRTKPRKSAIRAFFQAVQIFGFGGVACLPISYLSAGQPRDFRRSRRVRRVLKPAKKRSRPPA